jgi:hypothetical protein
MKGILKVRNIDSIKKLSLKRAIGKQKGLWYRMGKITTTILFLEEHNMLTIQQLWDILDVYLNYQIEASKLQYLIYIRKRTTWGNYSTLSQETMDEYIKKIAVNSHRVSSNLPYEIYYKYRVSIGEMERKINAKNENKDI